MSDTKKPTNQECVEFLDRYVIPMVKSLAIMGGQSNPEFPELTEIKGILEQQGNVETAEKVLKLADELQRIGIARDVEFGKDMILQAIQQPPLDDDLVEKTLEVVREFSSFGVFSEHNIARNDLSFKKQARRLLQSRQPDNS